MEYQDFLCAVLYRIKDILGECADIDIYESMKNNGNLRKGIIIKEKDRNIGPVIYMEEFYERYNKGVTLDKIVSDTIIFYRKVRCPENWDCNELLNIEKAKNKLAIKLINYSRNKEYLKGCPYIRVLDLAAIFFIVLDIKNDGLATVVITNEHMKQWNVNKIELYEMAVKNSCKVLPAKFATMQDTLGDLMMDEEIDSSFLFPDDEYVKEMYVLTNEYRNCGASCILYKGVLDMIGDILERNFFILPSSIHEVIILPAFENMEPRKLDCIIDDVNTTLVKEEELLGNHCYMYDRLTKEISFGYDLDRDIL